LKLSSFQEKTIVVEQNLLGYASLWALRFKFL
jgi:hypothetical protein